MNWMKPMIGVVFAIALLALGGCETFDDGASHSGGGGHSHSH